MRRTDRSDTPKTPAMCAVGCPALRILAWPSGSHADRRAFNDEIALEGNHGQDPEEQPTGARARVDVLVQSNQLHGDLVEQLDRRAPYIGERRPGG